MATTDKQSEPLLTEQQRLRAGSEFIEHAASLWPEGDAPDTDWIRDHVDAIAGLLELPLRHDGQDARRTPHRLHWWLWLRADLALPSAGNELTGG